MSPPVQVTLPAYVSVRLANCSELVPGSDRPPAAANVPPDDDAVIVPPLQVVGPVTVRLLLPVSVPPLSTRLGMLTAPSLLLKFAVPLLIVSGPGPANFSNSE